MARAELVSEDKCREEYGKYPVDERSSVDVFEEACNVSEELPSSSSGSSSSSWPLPTGRPKEGRTEGDFHEGNRRVSPLSILNFDMDCHLGDLQA